MIKRVKQLFNGNWIGNLWKWDPKFIPTSRHGPLGRAKQFCTSAFRVCSFTAWFSRLKCIKNDRKIQDMGQEMYIFMLHIVKITRRVQFFSSKISMITNVILILYNSSINNKLILRDLHCRRHIACFCCISRTKKLFHLSNMTVLRS